MAAMILKYLSNLLEGVISLGCALHRGISFFPGAPDFISRRVRGQAGGLEFGLDGFEGDLGAVSCLRAGLHFDGECVEVAVERDMVCVEC